MRSLFLLHIASDKKDFTHESTYFNTRLAVLESHYRLLKEMQHLRSALQKMYTKVSSNNGLIARTMIGVASHSQGHELNYNNGSLILVAPETVPVRDIRERSTTWQEVLASWLPCFH